MFEGLCFPPIGPNTLEDLFNYRSEVFPRIRVLVQTGLSER